MGERKHGELTDEAFAISCQTRQSLRKMTNLQEIFDYVKTASTDDLKKILNSVQNELPKREGMVDNYVEYLEDFCEDDPLLTCVWAECESLNLSPKRSKAPTAWLCSQETAYTYPDVNPVHAPIDIKKYPSINKLLSIVNNSTEVSGPLDSCLVIKYNSKTSSLSMHDDGESLIDQKKSICSFSLGCERTLEFFECTGSKPRCAKKIRMKNNSLVVMRPGTQQNLKHSVRAEPGKKEDFDSKDNIRYALSFRAIVKSTPAPGPKVGTTPADVPKSQGTGRRVTLVAGDSYAARLDAAKLGKGKADVVNIAEGGARMDKVQKQLEQFSEKHPGVHVEKLLLRIGTNDIRHVKDFSLLKGPLKQLSSKINILFPNCKVYVQSLLPLPTKNDSDWLTNRRVIDFNRILFNECIFRRFFYIDAFHPFTKFKRSYKEPVKRFDPLFEKSGIHPNSEKGLGVLARFYIRAIHSKYFNPYVYQ